MHPIRHRETNVFMKMNLLLATLITVRHQAKLFSAKSCFRCGNSDCVQVQEMLVNPPAAPPVLHKAQLLVSSNQPAQNQSGLFFARLHWRDWSAPWNLSWNLGGEYPLRPVSVGLWGENMEDYFRSPTPCTVPALVYQRASTQRIGWHARNGHRHRLWTNIIYVRLDLV